MAGVVVDGPRPAVRWVTSLPREWRVTESERLTLMCLASDAYGWESAPGYDAVAEWTGMHRSSAAAVLARLTKPTEYRPALLERISVGGRRRTVWRLLGDPEPSGDTGRFDPSAIRPAAQDGLGREPSGDTGRFDPSAIRPAWPDGSDPIRPAWPDGSDVPTVGEPSPNRPATPDTPFALIPTTHLGGDSHQSADAAPEPPRRCTTHEHHPTPPPCGQCADARHEHDAWLRAQRPKPVPTVTPMCPDHPDQRAGHCLRCVSDAVPSPLNRPGRPGRHAVTHGAVTAPPGPSRRRPAS